MSLRDRIARRLLSGDGERAIFWDMASNNPDRNAAARTDGDATGSPVVDLGERRKQAQAVHRAEFPWLFDPVRGVRWDFDPVHLRNLAQQDVWVAMLVESIATEVAATPWQIVENNGPSETAKATPTERTRVGKAADGEAADELRELLRDPNPDHDWQDLAHTWMADLLEIGSAAAVKNYPEGTFESDRQGEETTIERSVDRPGESGSITWTYTIAKDVRPAVDLTSVRPLEIQPTAPEVWTKEYADRSGVLSGFWQFDRKSRPGEGSTDRDTRTRTRSAKPTHFDRNELVWTDNAPRSNRRYGLPPTLTVKPFLEMMDLAVEQESTYYDKGSIPSGALFVDDYDQNEVKDLSDQFQADTKGKPHKWGIISGSGTFESFSYNLDEMDFNERQRWYARVIAAAFQVPTAVVGVEPEKVNYSTFSAERANFESNTLGPYLQLLERAVNDQIVHKHFGTDIRFELQPGLSETARQTISERVRAEFDSGLIRRNEARRKVGYDEVDDDEDGFRDDVTESPAEEEALALSKGEGERDSPDDPLREAGGMAQAFTVQPSDIEALQDEIEAPIAEVFERLLDNDDIMDTIASLASDETAKSLTDLTRQIEALLRDVDVTDAMIAAVSAARGDMAEAALGRAISQTGEDIDTSQIAERVQARDIDFAQSFAQRMSEDIRETVADGWSDAQSSFEIGQELEEKADEFTGWEAERIARQELQQAAGEARSDFAAEVGKVEVWITAGDGRVREAHQAMDRTYKLPGEKWEVDYTDKNRGVKQENQPGDSEPGIGCRCDVLLVDFDELEDYGVDPIDDHRGV